MAASGARSQVERLWLMGGGIVALVVVLIGWFFFISPQRSQTSDMNSRVAATRQQNSVLQAKIDTLRAQNQNIAKYKTELTRLRLALPSSNGVPTFLRTLQSIGNATQTEVNSLSVGAPTDVSAVAASTPTAPTTSGASNSTTPSSTSATAAPAGTAGLAGPAGPQLYGLSITAQVSGSPAALNHFLEQLQSVQPRAVLITQLTEGSGATTPGAGAAGAAPAGSTLQLTMQAFVSPSSPAEQANLAAASHK
jgi:hypothetical protein